MKNGGVKMVTMVNRKLCSDGPSKKRALIVLCFCLVLSTTVVQ